MKPENILIGIVIILATLFAGFMTYTSEKGKQETIRNYETGKYIRIDGQRYTVTKQTLANGICYYIYEGHYKSFTIPCEVKNGRNMHKL